MVLTSLGCHSEASKEGGYGIHRLPRGATTDLENRVQGCTCQVICIGCTSHLCLVVCMIFRKTQITGEKNLLKYLELLEALGWANE